MHNYHKIANELLKKWTDYIAAQWRFICNDLPTVGVCSENHKYSKVKPLYKRDEKSCTTNYTPNPLPSSPTYLRKLCVTRVLLTLLHSTRWTIWTQKFTLHREGLNQFSRIIVISLNNKKSMLHSLAIAIGLIMNYSYWKCFYEIWGIAWQWYMQWSAPNHQSAIQSNTLQDHTSVLVLHIKKYAILKAA
jgi:hypothetical protein